MPAGSGWYGSRTWTGHGKCPARRHGNWTPWPPSAWCRIGHRSTRASATRFTRPRWSSRSELAAQGGIHRHCIATAARGRPAWRLRVPDGLRIGFDDGLQGRNEQDLAAEVGDFVLRRADGYWAYQLAVVVDDADQGITDIVRGADLLDSTPRQILLQRTLGLPTPRYLHLPLVLDAQGHKLSKSSVAWPVDPDAPLPALGLCWTLLGQDPAVLQGTASPAALLQRTLRQFQPAAIPARLNFHPPATTTGQARLPVTVPGGDAS